MADGIVKVGDSGTINNGVRATVNVGGSGYEAGIVEQDGCILISYPAPSGPRPSLGGPVIVGGKTYTIEAVETSRYLKNYIVLRVK